MDLLTAIADLLKSRPTVADLIGTGDSARITQDCLPQVRGRPRVGSTSAAVNFPAIVLHEISSDTESTLRTSGGRKHTTVQVDCYAESPASASALRKAVLGVCGYRGPAGDVFIQGIADGGGSGDIVFAQDGGDRHLRRRIAELLISHEEAIPVY